MKSLLLLLLLGSFVISATPSVVTSGLLQEKEIPKVEKVETASNLFKSDNLFLGGQPNLETLEWLKTQGVDLVINLRSEKENEEFSASAFNEKKKVKMLGMEYLSVPVAGYDSYTKENLAKLAAALNGNDNKVLIHCASCGRVSSFMMAYLVKYKGYNLAEAVGFGKQLKFKFPLEDMLDEEIVWETK